ncbi:MAG: AMP-binding protein [Acidobacteriota bacterium]
MKSLRRFLDEACAAAPERTFLYEADRCVSYDECARLTDAVAAEYLALGLKPGDRLAISLPTGSTHLWAWLAAAKIGAVACPLHTELAPMELQRALRHLEPHAWIADTQRLSRVDRALHPRHLIVSDNTAKLDTSQPDSDGASRVQLANPSSSSTHIDWNDLATSTRTLASVDEPDPQQVSDILTTSGTTGAPKSAMLSGRMALLTGEAFAWWLQLTSDDRLFTCLPLSHINARYYSTLGAIAARASLALAPKFSASRFWSTVGESGATVCNAIGAMLKILLERPASSEERSHRLRLVYAAPALGEPAHSHFEARTGTRLVIGYGLTESTFGFIQPLDASRDVASLGLPRSHPDPRHRAEVRLVDGEIQLRNDATFDGYFRDPDATAEAFDAGWLKTGDLARCDERGIYTFLGRKKLVIRRRGENLTPGEVEAVLEQHPAVLEAAVVGVPSPLGDDDVRAYVVWRDGVGVSEQELTAFCAQHLAGFKLPTQWRFVPGLPRTPTQRIAYHELPQE